MATWLGGGVAAILLYLLVSNTLWLLFGSRLLQSLPGVDIKGARGTLKIATMLALSLMGSAHWFVNYLFWLVCSHKEKPTLTNYIQLSIMKGARFITNINKKK